MMPKAMLTHNTAFDSQTTFRDLDDDCLALILGALSVRYRLRLEPVCRRFQKRMYRVVDALSIIFSPIRFELNDNVEGIGKESSYKSFLEFKNEVVNQLDQFLKPWRFRTLVSKISG